MELSGENTEAGPHFWELRLLRVPVHSNPQEGLQPACCWGLENANSFRKQPTINTGTIIFLI